MRLFSVVQEEAIIKRYEKALSDRGIKALNGKAKFQTRLGVVTSSLIIDESSAKLSWQWAEGKTAFAELSKSGQSLPYSIQNADLNEINFFFKSLNNVMTFLDAKAVNFISVKSSEESQKMSDISTSFPVKKGRKGKKGMKPVVIEHEEEERVEAPSEQMNSMLALFFTAAFIDRNGGKAIPEIVKKMGTWLEDAMYVINNDKLDFKPKDIEVIARMVISGEKTGEASGAISRIGAEILYIDKRSRHNFSFSRKDLEVLSSIGGYYRNRSDSSWQRVFKAVDLLKIPELSRQFAPKGANIGEIESVIGELNDIVKKLLKDSTTDQFILTFQQASNFTKGSKDRPTYERYLEKQRELRKLWNRSALGVLRKSPAPILIENFEKYMTKVGFRFSYVPDGFNAKIGLNGSKIELFTKNNEPIKGWPQQGRKIVMNNSFGLKGSNLYVFKAVDDETGMESAYYTYSHHESSRTERFTVVKDLMENILEHKSKWEAPLKNWTSRKPVTLEVMQSAQAYFMYNHQSRIGGKNNKTDGKRTYGTTTWKVGHIKKMDASAFIIKYSGKSGVPQTHRFKPLNPMQKKLITLLKVLIKDKKKTDPIWAYNGELASDAKFRLWLKSINFPSNPHKLRHCKGTKIALIMIAKNIPKIDESKSKDVQYRMLTKFFKDEIATKVAKALGHKSAEGEALFMTSVKSYIDPSVSRQWFSDKGFRPPNWIPKTDA